jgi:hypothetical protein
LCPFGDFTQHTDKIFFLYFRVNGDSNFALMLVSNSNRLPDLTVFPFPDAFSAAETFCSHIYGIRTAAEYGIHHFKTAAWSQQFVHGIAPLFMNRLFSFPAFKI